MDKNLKLTKGLFFSQRVLLELTSSGYTREKSYKIVQKIALQSWKNNTDWGKKFKKCKNYEEWLGESGLFSSVFGTDLDKVLEVDLEPKQTTLSDFTGEKKLLGKSVQKDMKKNKGNIMKFKSPDTVKEYCNDLAVSATSHSSMFKDKRNIFNSLIFHIINRVS